jgi:predicted ribosome quality control (RQC) complex YloA/Tae2 family protein
MTEPVTDRERGLWRGRSIARVVPSPDGLTILVGRSAADNDVLSLELGRPYDFWLHVAGESGSHVVVLNPDRLPRMPRETKRLAAALAARYSKAKAGGSVAVHLATCGDVGKPRGAAAGKVSLRRYETVYGRPEDAPEL